MTIFISFKNTTTIFNIYKKKQKDIRSKHHDYAERTKVEKYDVHLSPGLEVNQNLIGEENPNLIGEENANLIGEENANLIGEENANPIGEENANLIGEEERNSKEERYEFSFSEEEEELMTMNDVHELLRRCNEEHCKNTHCLITLIKQMKESNESLVGDFQDTVTYAYREINTIVKNRSEARKDKVRREYIREKYGIASDSDYDHEQMMSYHHEVTNDLEDSYDENRGYSYGENRDYPYDVKQDCSSGDNRDCSHDGDSNARRKQIITSLMKVYLGESLKDIRYHDTDKDNDRDKDNDGDKDYDSDDYIEYSSGYNIQDLVSEEYIKFCGNSNTEDDRDNGTDRHMKDNIKSDRADNKDIDSRRYNTCRNNSMGETIEDYNEVTYAKVKCTKLLEEQLGMTFMSKRAVRDLLSEFNEKNCNQLEVVVREMRECNEILVEHFEEAIRYACGEISASLNDMKQEKKVSSEKHNEDRVRYIELVDQHITQDRQEVSKLREDLKHCYENSKLQCNNCKGITQDRQEVSKLREDLKHCYENSKLQCNNCKGITQDKQEASKLREDLKHCYENSKLQCNNCKGITQSCSKGIPKNHSKSITDNSKTGISDNCQGGIPENCDKGNLEKGKIGVLENCKKVLPDKCNKTTSANDNHLVSRKVREEEEGSFEVITDSKIACNPDDSAVNYDKDSNVNCTSFTNSNHTHTLKECDQNATSSPGQYFLLHLLP